METLGPNRTGAAQADVLETWSGISRGSKRFAQIGSEMFGNMLLTFAGGVERGEKVGNNRAV